VIEITRSAWAMAFAVVVALLLATGKILQTIAFAILSGADRLGTANDLVTAEAWMVAVAGAAAVFAIGAAIWTTAVRRRWRELWEVAGAELATFVIAVGLLVSAATSPGGSQGANIVSAVGFGMWAALLTVKAAQRSLLERVRTDRVRQAPLWIAAAAGTLLIAVAAGLPNASDGDRGLALATALMWMIGLAALAGVLVVAHRQQLIVSRRSSELVAGLWTLVASYAASAIVAGAVFGPFPSLTGVRTGVAVASVIAVLAFGLLALAAWDRLRDLSLLETGPPPFEAAGGSSLCGHPLPVGAHFCPQCGAPAYSAAPTPTAATEVVIDQ